MAITLTPLGAFDGGANVADVNYAMGETRKLDAIVREIQTESNLTKLKEYSYQATAANLTVQSFMATRAGTISAVLAVAAVTAASGEDMTVDVQIGGVSCLTAVIDLDNTAGTTAQSGVVDTAANTLAAGDVVTIIRAYTAGGSATPMTGTSVSVDYQESV